jgi:hypothetical protein
MPAASGARNMAVPIGRPAILSRLVLAAALATSLPAAAAEKPMENWDGLSKVPSRRLDVVYLLPQADFRGYSKVIIDMPEVAFRKNWHRDRAGNSIGRISDSDGRRILDEAQEIFYEGLVKTYGRNGFEVVQAPGADVLRLSTAVANLDIEAPDVGTIGRTHVYTREAGSAVLVVEARDSLSGQLLGRAVDGRATDDFGPFIRNRATNTADFQRLFDDWAKASVKGLTELKALSPIDPATAGRRN